MSRERTLDEVRADIDSIDDAIQDLLIRRTSLVEEVRAIKRDWRVKIQPSREAEIIYRLIGRHHGPFPKRDLVAMWRILICATLSFEGPFSVAVYVPPEDDGAWDLAREHFGPTTPMRRHATVRAVIEAVRRQEAVVGVVPPPRQDDADPWWRHLATSDPDAPKIIARLPFAGCVTRRVGAPEALAICPVSVKPTGRDRSFIAAEWENDVDPDRLTRGLRSAGFVPSFATTWREAGTRQSWHSLAEVEGWLAPDDERLQRLPTAMGTMPKRLVMVGGYAAPLDEETLGKPATPQGLRPLRAKGASAAAL